MSRIYISIGSNVERDQNLRSSMVALQMEFSNPALSSVYESDAVGFEGDDFLNLVVRMDTEQSVADVDRILTCLEDEHGRIRTGPKFSPRTLDLDLLLYDDVVMKNECLELPRDEILRYAFVLGPLAEIAPDETHPVTGQTYNELWTQFDQASQPLKKIDFDWKDSLQT